MKRQLKKKPMKSVWAETGVALGQVLGTTSLLATMRWLPSEEDKQINQKTVEAVDQTNEDQNDLHPVRRILAPPLEAMA